MSDHPDIPDTPLGDLIARLERERQDADRVYNDALTALDHVIQAPVVLPRPPPPVDSPPISRDAVTREPGGFRSFIWRLLGSGPRSSAAALDAVIDRVNRSAAAQAEFRDTLVALLETTRQEHHALVRFEARLLEYLRTITLYVDTRDRRIGGDDVRDRLSLLEQRLALIKRDVQGGAAPGPAAETAATVFADRADSTTYVGFEDRFRGARAEIGRRVDDYAAMLAGCSGVLDVGCGRGELLELLKARGVQARGVDGNHAMVELCRSRGLEAEQSDALSYLERQPDASLGALTAIQVVEHFAPAYLARFLEAAYHKLTPGAPIVLETINPMCWMAFFETYIRDLTHQQPLHPDTLKYLVEASGFTKVDVQFRSPVTDADRLARVSAAPGTEAALAAVINDHADKLNARLFSSMDYVVIGRR